MFKIVFLQIFKALPGLPLVTTLTSKRSVRARLQVHLAVAPLAHLLGVVADVVATVLTAAQADALLEAVGAGALVGKAHVVLVHQGVYK